MIRSFFSCDIWTYVNMVLPAWQYRDEANFNDSLMEKLAREKNGDDFVLMPAGLTKLHLVAFCSLVRVPLYMGNCDGQPFDLGNQSFGHTLNGDYSFCPTEQGFIKIYQPETAEWTDDSDQMMSVEEVLYTFCMSLSEHRTAWKPEEDLAIKCRENKGLNYYPASGWEIVREAKDGAKGLKRNFIPY